LRLAQRTTSCANCPRRLCLFSTPRAHWGRPLFRARRSLRRERKSVPEPNWSDRRHLNAVPVADLAQDASRTPAATTPSGKSWLTTAPAPTTVGPDPDAGQTVTPPPSQTLSAILMGAAYSQPIRRGSGSIGCVGSDTLGSRCMETASGRRPGDQAIIAASGVRRRRNARARRPRAAWSVPRPARPGRSALRRSATPTVEASAGGAGRRVGHLEGFVAGGAGRAAPC
jgi:hypothetical protein